MKNKLIYRFYETGVADELDRGQWAVWEGQLEHPDGTLQDAFCQGAYHGLDGGDFAAETLENEDGDPIKLPEGAILIQLWWGYPTPYGYGMGIEFIKLSQPFRVENPGESRGLFLFISMRKKDRDNKVGIYLDTNKDDSQVVQAALLGLGFKWKAGNGVLNLPDNSTVIVNIVAKNKFLEWNELSPEKNLLDVVYNLSKVSEIGVVECIKVVINPPKPPPDKYDKLPLVEFEYFDTDWALIRIRVDNVNNNFYFGYNVLYPDAKKEKFERARMRNINFLEFGGQVIDEDPGVVLYDPSPGNSGGDNQGGGQGGGKDKNK